MDANAGRRSRREVLGAAGTVAAVGLAGCLGTDGGDNGNGDGGNGGGNGNGGGRPTPERQLSTPVAGDPDAAVTVAAYEDFACPHCGTYSLDVVPRLREEYVATGDIRYEWHDFPIPVDERHSWLAADAARAVQATADSIDAFWEYVHRLFERQTELSLDLYAEQAAEVGVDADTVRTLTEDHKYEPTVVASRQAGIDRGVAATPTVFVDDEKLEAPSYADLSDAIDAALDAA